jgi:hypothetical protein
MHVIDFLKKAKKHDEWLNGKRCTTTKMDDPIHLHGVKRKSLFFNLPYWQVSIKFELSIFQNVWLLMTRSQVTG